MQILGPLGVYFDAVVKFIYSEKATKFCEIFTSLLTGTKYTQDKSKVKISQNFVAFSEYMNFSRSQEEFTFIQIRFTLMILQLMIHLQMDTKPTIYYKE